MLTAAELEELRKADEEIDRAYENFDVTGVTDPKELRRLRAREYYYNNREKVLAYQRQWRESHREQECERGRRYREAHREEIRERDREARRNDPERFKKYHRKCYLKKKARELQDVREEERR